MEALTRQWIADYVLPYEPVVRSYFARTFAPDEVDEAIQEGYARLCVLDLSRVENPKPFFMRIVRNLLIDRRRRANVVRIDSVAEYPVDLELDDALGPERVVSARQEYERLLSVIEMLKPKHRQVFILSNFEELSVSEISKRLKLNPKTAESRLRYANVSVTNLMYGGSHETVAMKKGIGRETRKRN